MRLRHFAFVRANERDALCNELRQIALRCLVRPHAWIHRRRQENFCGRCQEHRCGEIVGMTASQFCHQVGRRRGNHDQVSFACEPNVSDVKLTGQDRTSQ